MTEKEQLLIDLRYGVYVYSLIEISYIAKVTGLQRPDYALSWPRDYHWDTMVNDLNKHVCVFIDTYTQRSCYSLRCTGNLGKIFKAQGLKYSNIPVSFNPEFKKLHINQDLTPYMDLKMINMNHRS
jgi:hypothetical protein